jgi:CheY-like chemotaxis protein
MPTVMVVEDDPLLLELLVEVLQDCRLEVVPASRLGEALAVFESRTLDAIITDLSLAGPSGTEGFVLLRRVRRRCPHLPVLVITGSPEPDRALRGAILGASGFLRKPFSLQQLVDALQACGLRLSWLPVPMAPARHRPDPAPVFPRP